MRDAGFRVSTFHNPGSLLGTDPAHVEIHAIRDGQFYMMSVFAAEHDHPEYVAVCRLDKQCAFEL